MPTITTALPGMPAADTIIRAYMSEVASRYYGRPASPGEVYQALLDEPYDDLVGGSGTFLVATEDGEPIACAGARFVGDAAELTKVFTLPAHRGRGVGKALVTRIEEVARARGLRTVRLDTRADLAEACALYERLGFAQVPAFNDEPYSDRWYEKTLVAAERR